VVKLITCNDVPRHWVDTPVLQATNAGVRRPGQGYQRGTVMDLCTSAQYTQSNSLMLPE